jgi:hypothetical protein
MHEKSVFPSIFDPKTPQNSAEGASLDACFSAAVSKVANSVEIALNEPNLDPCAALDEEKISLLGLGFANCYLKRAKLPISCEDSVDCVGKMAENPKNGVAYVRFFWFFRRVFF